MRDQIDRWATEYANGTQLVTIPRNPLAGDDLAAKAANLSEIAHAAGAKNSDEVCVAAEVQLYVACTGWTPRGAVRRLVVQEFTSFFRTAEQEHAHIRREPLTTGEQIYLAKKLIAKSRSRKTATV